MPSLTEALATAPETFQVGFAQSPAWMGFVRREGSTLTSLDGTVDLTWVFDVRLFAAAEEFHWWWDQQSGDGRSFVLNDPAASARGWTRLQGAPAQRLLRGVVVDSAGGWAKIHDGHSRPLWVPAAGAIGAQLAIGAVEYTSIDEHGNVGVVAERLTSIHQLTNP